MNGEPAQTPTKLQNPHGSKLVDAANAVTEFRQKSAMVRQQIETAAFSNPRISSAMSANPFAVLECTVRDSSEQIVEAAESRSLVMEPTLCTTAKATLINPRLRLGAEMGWLPGVAPGKATDLVSRAEKGMPALIKVAATLPNVAACNLLVTTIEASAKHHPEVFLLKELYLGFFDCVEKIDEATELRLINEDRTVARFPAVATGMTEALDECRKRWGQCLRPVLRETVVAAEALGDALDTLTDSGAEPASPFISAVVADYADDIAPELRLLHESLQGLIEDIKKRVVAANGVYPDVRSDYGYIVEHIIAWHRLTHAMQLVARSHGTDEPSSIAFGYELRGLCLFLANEHDIYDLTEELTRLMSVYFCGVESFQAKMREDQTALSDLNKKRLADAEKERKGAEECALNTEVGGNRLVIDSNSISFRGITIPLAEVTHVRYGVYKHYTNGIRDSRKYTVWVGGRGREIKIECSTLFASDTKVEALYELVTDKVWAAICRRLVHETLIGLHNDRRYQFGNVIFHRTGAILARKHFWKADEPVLCDWSDLSTGTDAGCWLCWCTNDKKVDARLSFRDDNNTHIIAAVLRFLWKDGNHLKLAQGTLFQ